MILVASDFEVTSDLGVIWLYMDSVTTRSMELSLFSSSRSVSYLWQVRGRGGSVEGGGRQHREGSCRRTEDGIREEGGKIMASYVNKSVRRRAEDSEEPDEKRR